MLKIVTPNAWSFDAPITQLVKVSSRGLLGGDRSALIKRAGHAFADALSRLDFQPGEVPVHVIAVGATETYNCNRNGDGFPRAACERYHDTFRKHARWYRNHQNRDKTKGRGIVKLSLFNRDMDRIELLVALNATKEAADRNGGLVADEELEKLSSGHDLPVSMGCKVPFDTCSGCHHKAKNRSEYCTADTCSYGGLQQNLAKLAEDGHILHAINDTDVDFFDISKVFRGADRTAFTLGVLQKAAQGRLLSGAELAELEHLTLPDELVMHNNSPLAKVAADLRDSEQLLAAAPDNSLLAAVSPDLRTKLEWSPDPRFVTNRKLAQLTRALADTGIVLPVEEWLFVLNGNDREKAAAVASSVSSCLPGMCEQVAVDTTGENPYYGEECPPPQYREWSEKLAADYSLFPQFVTQRLQLSALRDIKPTHVVRSHNKQAASSGPAYQLARQYVQYQVAALEHIRRHGHNFPLTLKLAVMQNYAA